MRYFVTLAENAEPRVVDVVELPSGALKVTLDGKPVQVDVLPLEKGLSIRVDGQVIDLSVEGTLPDIGAVASGHRSYVRVESERARAAEASKRAGRPLDKTVKSPMPGRVVKVHVAAGDVVTVGQPLLVIEAMKMENELKAKLAGTIAEVFVGAGTAVEANAKLLSFE